MGVMTARFASAAEMMRRVLGMPDYPFVVISHPIANNDDETIRAKAEDAVQQCLAILLKR
jgi:hypothetical protein